MPAVKVELYGFEAAVETALKVEGKSLVVDRLAKVMEGVCHALELAAVLGDVEVALSEVTEGGVEVEGASFIVTMKL